MRLQFLYPFWGSESMTPGNLFDYIRTNGFDGLEINIPNNAIFETHFYDALLKERKQNQKFKCVLQQVVGIQKETTEDYLTKVIKRLESLVHYQPDFINSHTGRDYFSFDDNCRVIEAIEDFSVRHNIPVYHEIHRGRFTFHSRTTLKYLKVFPEMKLVGDLSHWCVVSESMLQNQEEIINQVIPSIHHIHTRIGFEQSPQVNDPFAPEWESYMAQYLVWWKQIIHAHSEKTEFSLTPEFGPFPYMPQQPYSKEPLADQRSININMRDYLKTHLS